MESPLFILVWLPSYILHSIFSALTLFTSFLLCFLSFYLSFFLFIDLLSLFSPSFFLPSFLFISRTFQFFFIVCLPVLLLFSQYYLGEIGSFCIFLLSPFLLSVFFLFFFFHKFLFFIQDFNNTHRAFKIWNTKEHQQTTSISLKQWIVTHAINRK